MCRKRTSSGALSEVGGTSAKSTAPWRCVGGVSIIREWPRCSSNEQHETDKRKEIETRNLR